MNTRGLTRGEWGAGGHGILIMTCIMYYLVQPRQTNVRDCVIAMGVKVGSIIELLGYLQGVRCGAVHHSSSCRTSGAD